MISRGKKWLLHGLSLALAAGLLTWLLVSQDWNGMFGHGLSIRWCYLVLAGATGAGYWVLKSARWQWIVLSEGQEISPGRACLSMLAGLGVGLATPFRGGEVVRSMFLPPGARVRLSGWVVIERLFDLSAVLILSMIGLAYVIRSNLLLTSGGTLLPWLTAACPVVLAAALGLPLLVLYRPPWLWRPLTRLLPGKTKELAEVRLQWRQFWVLLATSLVGEAMSVIAVYFCMMAFGEIGFFTAFALIPVVMLHNLMPLTPGGFGVREGFAILVFSLFGFPRTMVVAGYLTDALLVLVVPGVIGVLGAWLVGVLRSGRREEQA